MRISYFLQIQPNLDLSKLQFRPEGVSDLTLIVPFVLLGILFAGVAVAVYMHLRKREAMEEMNRLREETRVKLMVSEFSLGMDDQQFLVDLTGSQSPGRHIPLLESRNDFEEAVREFRRQNPQHPGLKLVPNLRQKLGYGFGNMRNSLNDTRMIPVGSRLQCQIARSSNDIVFLTNVVGTNEHQFFIRPPMAKGKPVSIAHVPTVTLKISREGDAEYEITAKVKGETPNEMKAVILEHSSDIQKLAFRNAPRMEVALESKFYVVRQAIAETRGHSKFKAQDSQYSFAGSIKDLSIGGALVVIKLGSQNPEVGDWVMFRLPQAQILEDMVGEVVRLTELDDSMLQLHLRFSGIKEINRLKMNRFLEVLRGPKPQEAVGARPV